MLSALNATRVLQTDQYKLRKVLKYHINSLDQYQEHSTCEDEIAHPSLVIQKMLSISTQPSPLKPSFSLEEMQLAALNLSQYMAAEGTFEKPITISNDKNSKNSNMQRENNSELPTPNSECSVKSVVSEKTSKKKKSEESDAPLNPIVSQIIEMGFTKKAVESAMKSIGMYCMYV